MLHTSRRAERVLGVPRGSRHSVLRALPTLVRGPGLEDEGDLGGEVEEGERYSALGRG